MEKPFQRNDFYEILKQNGISLSDQQKQQFQTYMEMLIDWNTRMNLTAITNPDEIYEKHFLDSLLPSFHIEMKGSLCDIGAGAGFPSIPLKIVYPELDVTIIEPLGKRITFLTALCEALDIQVCLRNERAEDAIKTTRETYDIVTARAVANLTMLAELCIPFVKRDGIFLAMKGSKAMDELDLATYAIHKLGCKFDNSYEEILQSGTRIDLVFRKVKSTPKQYPRNFGQMKKHPLQEGIV